jgi:hypothetical protein
MKNKLCSTSLLALSCLAAVLALPPLPAHACGNSIRHKVHRPTKSVKKAELLLAKGAYQTATDMVRELHPFVHHYQRETSSALNLRAQRVVALAVVRSDGKADFGGKLRGSDRHARDVRIAWATMALDVQSWHAPDDLVLRTELAEALAATPVHRARAHALLADLAERDLMPTARGFMILAQLEQERGQKERSEAAALRCKEIAGGSGVCAWS